MDWRFICGLLIQTGFVCMYFSILHITLNIQNRGCVKSRLDFRREFTPVNILLLFVSTLLTCIPFDPQLTICIQIFHLISSTIDDYLFTLLLKLLIYSVLTICSFVWLKPISARKYNSTAVIQISSKGNFLLVFLTNIPQKRK